MQRGGVSFWYKELGGLPKPRPALDTKISADVCIIGAGYTGLWTAYYLKKADPSLNIVIVEKNFAGFGASGRNGGWLSGNFAWDHEKYLTTGTADQIKAMAAHFHASVDEVILVTEAEAIEADIHRTEELSVATNPAQLARLSPEVARLHHWGDPRSFVETAKQSQARVNIPGALGAIVTPGVARIQPAKLVRGLADVVARMGVQIFEQTAADTIVAGKVTTARGAVSCKFILRATEGYTVGLPGLKRQWLPLHSAQIITEPLPKGIWRDIGWDGAELLGDMANAYCYCQRTADGRIAVGGRGLPYLFNSKIQPDGTPTAGTISELKAILARMFPAALDVPLAHAWQGVLGVPRDWCATVGLEPETNIGWAGGYVGIGVSSSNVAGRTLRDLVLGQETPLTALPWVNRAVRQWEPEPFRWLAVRSVYAVLKSADRAEARGQGHGPKLARFGSWIKSF